jgi:hypothetical protein
MANKMKTVDPIKEDPLRDPGQSLREDLNDLLIDKVVFWMAMVAVVVIFALVEWYRWALNVPPSPIVATVGAVVLAAVATWRIRLAWPRIRQLRLGLRGEQSIGQFLQDELLPRGYKVFHDICQDEGNIDHVVIGPGGVFSVETKTNSKPERGDARVRFDGHAVTVDGHAPDRDPVAQARACADGLRKILAEYSGKDVDVRAVILYPGWYVDEARGSPIWVLNRDRFIGYVKNEPKKLSEEEIRVLVAALARYVRDRNKSK